MLDSIGMNVNLFNQLKQREIYNQVQRTPHAFAAQLYRERFRVAKNLYKYDLRAHYGCVNAIEFSNGGKYLASGGDDKRVLIWDIEMSIAGLSRPRILETEHTSNIFCLGFDRPNRKIFSGGNDDLVIVHDFETGKLDNVYKHDNPVYGLSIDPQCDSIFATACEDGQILVFDQRSDPADPLVVAQLRTSFHAVEFHPSGGNFLVTANSKRGAAFWDIRKPHHPVIQYGYLEDPPSCMSVRFNSTGSLILALRRRLPPILYNTQSAEPICTFYHGNYYNSCTMKSCTFAGEDDEFVLSGSDDFNLYVWRVSDVDLERTDQWVETTQMVLYGHRSIVNQVRYNRQKCLLASSGVEKIIKLWSPFAQKGWTGCLLEEASAPENPRELYSPYNFPSMSTPPHSWSHMSHDYSSRNTNEDPRMMAFFDSLIQQEIEGWDTNSSTDSPVESEGSCSNSSSNGSSSESSHDDDDDDDDDAGDENRTHAERRSQRSFVRRKERKHPKSAMGKVRIQRNKYTNRIAYLIATKRNTLRRLAIKGASLSNRGLHKIVKVNTNVKRNTKSSSGSNSKIARSYASKRRVAYRQNLARNCAIATTSTGAVGSSSSYRSQRRKHKKLRYYETSSDDDTELGNPVASGSSRYSNTAYSNNMPVPSTSTGITSSLKDDIIRLRQQQQQQNIDDSDEDDDDYQPRATLNGISQRTEIVVDPTVQPTKKLNGVRRANDAAVMGRSSSGAPSVNTTLLSARSHINGSILIQSNLSSHQQQQHNSNSQQDSRIGYNQDVTAIRTHDARNERSTDLLSSSAPIQTTTTSSTSVPTGETTESASATLKTTLLPQSNKGYANSTATTTPTTAAAIATTTTTAAATNRRRPHIDLLDQYSSHSNSRLSNSSYQDELLDDSSSSSSSPSSFTASAAIDVTQSTTPFKRRKIQLSSEFNNRRSNEIIHESREEENNNDGSLTANYGNNSNNCNNNYCYQRQQQNNEQHQHHNINSKNTNDVNTHLTNNNKETSDGNDDNNDDDCDEINKKNNNNNNNRTPTNERGRHYQTVNNHHNNYYNNYSSQQDVNSNNDFATTSSSSTLLQTPDSGISVSTITPNFDQDTDDADASTFANYRNGGDNAVISVPITVTANQQQQLYSPCNENSANKKVSINLFHQKVARVRRNYRRKFADESESD